MKDRKWVSALELNRWADTNDAKTRLPQLIRRLVNATIDPENLEHIDFHAGEETHRPGYDGETKTKEGNAKVPQGIAFWEIGTDLAVKQKLDDDYKKRVDNRAEGDFSQVTYIAVTPRDYQKKQSWTEEKDKLKQWREVRVYDSDDLEQWLEMAPAVAIWLASYATSTPPTGLWDLSTHWDNLQESLKRPLPANVLLVSRQQTVAAFKKWLDGPAEILAVLGQSLQEVIDVFTAWVDLLRKEDQEPVTSRAIIIEDIEAWDSLAKTDQHLILICSERLQVDGARLAQARKKGHHVLLPVSSLQARMSEAHILERMNRQELEAALRASGLSEHEAYTLAQYSAGSFSILKRRFSSLPLVSTPSWGTGQPAEELAPLLLAGAWQDEREADKAIIAKLTGKSYDEARRIAVRWQSAPDAPVRWNNGLWEFGSPLDAWAFLNSVLSPAQLDVFEQVALEALGVDDPRLDLQPDERWQANIHSKKLLHSSELRQGIARTLAIVATQTELTRITDTTPLQTRVDRIVGAILPVQASWRRWASLGSLLPLMAEAAPRVVLEAAEAGVRGDCELAKLFGQETGGITGRAEHTGLLWALERLAWSPDYLSRVSIVFAKLAERDPGGQWANRPAASLRDLFFSWMPHTTATLDQRLEVLQLILDRHPQIGWKLLLELLPQGAESISTRRTPDWRFWAEGWSREVTRPDYVETIKAYTAMALSFARKNPDKWPELVEHITTFPPDAFNLAIEELRTISDTALPGDVKQSLWTALRDEAQKHRYFHTANWALPSAAVVRLEELRDKLKPEDPVELNAPLFTTGFDMIADEDLPWEEQSKLRDQLRSEAVTMILEHEQFQGIIRLVHRVEDTWGVGIALANTTEGKYDSEVLPVLLRSEDKVVANFARAYSGARISRAGRDWAERQPFAEWQEGESAAFVASMPFDQRTWDFVQRLGNLIENEYWRQTGNYGPGLSSEAIKRAAWKFIEIGRLSSAIDLLALTKNEEGSLSASAILEILEEVMKATPTETSRPLDGYHIQTILKKVQNDPDIDVVRLGRVEWQLLPIFGHRAGSPATLTKVLSQDPDFFVQILMVLFYPHDKASQAPSNEAKPEPDESARQQAERAWRLLRDWKQPLPGAQPDGTINTEALREWVVTARQKATAVDRAKVCDITIGELLANAPAEDDESWPCVAVREVLETADSGDMEQGFRIGIHNWRGTYTKALYEGGRQERELANKYDGWAEKCQNRWLRTAAVLRQVAADYREQAEREDAEAEAQQ